MSDSSVGAVFKPPTPYDEETYRKQLRAWFDAIPSNDSPGSQRAQWEYICSLAGVNPGNDKAAELGYPPPDA